MQKTDGAESVALVLAGGGARGLAHVGVLRALEALGVQPSALVGVSMGALVAAAYALRHDWYRALLELDTRDFPHPLERAAPGMTWTRRARLLLRLARAGYDLFAGWGAGTSAAPAGQRMLRRLLGAKDLQQGRVPVAVCATDLMSGKREVMTSGDAAEAVYASAALAGVLPPLRRGDRLLVDGAYSDLVPVDVARRFGDAPVVAVDVEQALLSGEVYNGFQSLTRAVEICQMTHAHLRFEEADLVLRPVFRRRIDTLDFSARRECVAAGIAAVRNQRRELRRLRRARRGGG